VQTETATQGFGRGVTAGAHRPPGPKGLPLLGNLPELARDLLGFFGRCSREYGEIVGFRLGMWPALLLSNPRDIEQVLVKEHHNFVKHRFFWRHVTAIFGNGLLTSEGDVWVRQRHLAAPAFSGQRLASYGDAMVGYTRRMLDGWKSGEVRDVHADMMAVTLRIAAKTLFSAEVEHEVAEIDDALNVLMEEIASRFTRPFPIPDALPIPSNIRYRRSVRQIEAVVERIIRERRSTGQDAGDLLSLLMQARDENGKPMSDRQLRDETFTILLAGHETTALTLSWAWYLLGRHAEIQDQLQAEISNVLGQRAPTVDDLPKLRFTENVISEAMRLYPPAYAVGRESLRACEIGGYFVPAGTTIFASQWVQHRDPRYYDDPTAFRPSRWAGDLARKLPRFAYFPFGGGPRICIGMRFAMMEAVLILATMAQRFRLEWQPDRVVVPFPSITLRPKGGIWVKTAARNQITPPPTTPAALSILASSARP
jgi:cytochrome P450